MSSFDRRTILMMPLALAACGFTPVYAPGGAGSALRNRVLVDPPSDRDGFLLVQDLEERLGRGADAQYGLSVALAIDSEGLAITAEGVITRYNLVGTATYALRALDDGAVVTSGKVSNFTGYSATGSTVETLASERDARTRLMTILADQITTQLYTATLLQPA